MKQILFTLCFLVSSSFLFGQAKKIDNVKVSDSKVVFLGKSQPLVDLVAKDATSKSKKSKFKKDKKKPVNFRGRSEIHNVAKPELEFQGVDPVWQSSHSRSPVASEPLVNIEGLFSNGSPHDPTLAVGINYVLQSVNATRVGVWDKEGNEVMQFNMNTLWTEFGANSAGDPILLFDQEAQRWMLSEFTDPANLLIAISETSDPLGSYYAYTFSTPSFPDYPKYGFWTDHLVVTSNEGGAGTLTQYFIERDSLLIGADARMQQVEVTGTSGSEQGFIVSTPVDWEGQTRPEDSRPVVLKLNDSSWGAVAEDAIELYRFDINYEDSDSTVVESLLITTSPYDGYPCSAAGIGFSCIPQPNSNAGLDGIPEVIMNAPQYRNFGTHEAIVLSFVTDVSDGLDHAGVRWMELRRTTDQDWSLYQESSYAPDDNHRFMSGVGIDRKGNIALAYNISSDSVFAGIRYTGRFANDALGQMTLPEVSAIEGNSTLNSNGRFADYSQIAVDPVDGSTFWFTTEYADGGVAHTRIISFELAQDTFDMAMVSILNPNSSSDLTTGETVEVEVRNTGLNVTQSYDISLSLEGTQLEMMSISDPLNSGESRVHTFATPIDMSALGDYNLSATVTAAIDENPNNNTATKRVSQRTGINASLSVSGPPTTCNIASLINITVGNEGDIALTEATIDFYLGGMIVDTEEWTGNLQFGDSETFEYLLTGIPDGENEYEIVITHGGGEDLLPGNNTVSYSLNSIGTTGLINFIMIGDQYPQEVSWNIFEEGNDEPIASGGNYAGSFDTFTEEICLDPNACYTFEMTDSYGDGICCAFGEGNYGLYNGQGIPIFTSMGEFGSTEITNFCASDTECAIVANIEVQDVATDGTLGSIMVTPSGGAAPYSYSIDGGVTFQESNVFDNLEVGDYSIIVATSDESCSETFEAIVSMLSSLGGDLENDMIIKSTPNPSDGFFDLSIENYQSNEVFIHFNVYDAQGKLVQSRRMANYSGVYKTQVSLLEYASGTYFIRFLDEDINQLVKIIKL